MDGQTMYDGWGGCGVPQGWQCPVCGHVYAPTWPWCTICGGKHESITNTGTRTGGCETVREFMVHGGDWAKPEEMSNKQEEGGDA